MIKPTNATEAIYKNASMLFFPLYLEALISNPQQRVYNLADRKPHHLTCIIGIDATVVVDMACLARQHPLFANVKTFTYLVPSSIDIDDFVDEDDVDDQDDDR